MPLSGHVTHNAPDHGAKCTAQHDKRGKFPLVTVATMDQIYASGAGPAAVVELGAYIAERSLGGVPPLS